MNDEEIKENQEFNKKCDAPEFHAFLKKWGALMDQNYNIHIPKTLCRDIDLICMFWAEHDFLIGLVRKGRKKKSFGKTTEQWLNLAIKYPGLNQEDIPPGTSHQNQYNQMVSV